MRSTLQALVLGGLCSTGLFLSAQAQAQAVDADAAQALAKKEGCLKCHAVDKKKEAKSLMDISKSLKVNKASATFVMDMAMVHLCPGLNIGADGVPRPRY